MKLLVDNNLSPKLTKILSKEFPESKHLMDLNLENASDMDVWIYAKEKNFMIISKDTDLI